MRKKTLQAAANLQQRMEWYEKSPYYAKKYVTNRTNSLAEMKRIYVWLTGVTRGLGPFERTLKETYPGAERHIGKNVQWHFNQDDLWEFLMAEERFARIIKHRRIRDFEDLCIQALVY